MKTITTVGLLALVVAVGGCGVQNRTSLEVTSPLHWKIAAGSSAVPPPPARSITASTTTYGVMDVAFHGLARSPSLSRS